MDWLHLLQVAAVIIVVGAGLGAGFGGFYYAFRSKQTKLLQERVNDIQNDYEKCDTQHKDSLKMIHILEGKVEVLQTIPLQSIAQSLEELKNLASQEVTEQRVHTQVIEQPIVNGSTA